MTQGLEPLAVAVLGLSSRPSRYAHRAARELQARGFAPIGINPALPELNGIPVVRSVRELPPGVGTLTVYVGPERSARLADEITAYGFRRVIFNPGAENPELASALEEKGVQTEESCTLVLLATGRF